jgi:hypothetical protein
LERSESVLQLLYLSLGQISLKIVSDLQFLTAAHSQVRFDVVVKIFVLKFSQQIQGWPPIVLFQQHDGVFIVYP